MINGSGISKPGRRGPRLLLALGLGAAAAACVYLYVTSVQRTAEVAPAGPPPVPTSPVLVAKISIPAQSALTPDNVEVRSVPSSAVQPNALTSLDDVRGKVPLLPLAASQQVLGHMLADPQQPPSSLGAAVPAGKRAMSVTFTEHNSVGGLIAPGDYVDVIGVFNKNTLGKDQSMLLLQDVQVLAVAQATAPDQLRRAGDTAQNPASPAPTPSQSQPNNRGTTTAAAMVPLATPAAGLPVAPAQTRTLTLAVDADAAERLALAEDNGDLRYLVRPNSERTQSTVPPADLSTLVSPIQVAAGQIIATEISPSNTKVGDTIDVKITVKNTSDKPLQSEGPEPGFTYVQGQTYFTQQFASDPGKWRVGIGTANLDTTELPYRWGLGGDLAPGASTTVTGHIKVTQDFKATNFWAALVNEPSTVVQTGVGMTLVTSLPDNLAVVAVDVANVRSSPSIAAGVMDQVKYGTELQIIGQSADWFKIKLPDSREGWVAAGWIVTAGSPQQ